MERPANQAPASGPTIAAAAAGREAALEVRRRKKGERQALVRQLVDAAVPQMQLHVELKERFGVKASSRTVRDDVKELGYGQRLARRHPAPGLRPCEREGCPNFHAPTDYQVARGWGRFCSRACHYASRYVAEPEECVCAYKHCPRKGVPFTPYPSEAVRPNHGQFCSQSCKQLHFWRADEGVRVAAIRASLDERWLWGPRADQHWGGVWGGAKGAEYGVLGFDRGGEGGAPVKATPEEAQEVWRLWRENETLPKAERVSPYRISELVFGDRRFHMRVRRQLGIS